MATIEFLQNRLNSANDKLVKLEKKLERILKAEESNYQDNNPYYYSDYDKKHCLRDIEECKSSIEKYSQQIACETEKSNSRNVPAIIEFLELWKERAYNYYKKDLTSYYNEKDALNQLFKDYDNNYARNYSIDKTVREQKLEQYDSARKMLHCKLHGYKERRTFINPWGKEDYADVKVRDGEWEHLTPYVYKANSLDDALTIIEKDLEKEKNRKYDHLIERVNKVAGQIIDATNLKVGANCELNGIIIGNKCKARVETIFAGGYHIQILHTRLLVHEVK